MQRKEDCDDDDRPNFYDPLLEALEDVLEGGTLDEDDTRSATAAAVATATEENEPDHVASGDNSVRVVRIATLASFRKKKRGREGGGGGGGGEGLGRAGGRGRAAVRRGVRAVLVICLVSALSYLALSRTVRGPDLSPGISRLEAIGRSTPSPPVAAASAGRCRIDGADAGDVVAYAGRRARSGTNGTEAGGREREMLMDGAVEIRVAGGGMVDLLDPAAVRGLDLKTRVAAMDRVRYLRDRMDGVMQQLLDDGLG